MTTASKSCFPILLAAIEAHFFKPVDYSAWATKLIASTKYPSDWMIKVAIEEDQEKLITYLYGACAKTNESLPLGQDEILAGFLILRYQKSEISLSQLLIELFDLSDPSDSLKIEPDDIAEYLDGNVYQQHKEEQFLKDHQHYLNQLSNFSASSYNTLFTLVFGEEIV